LKLNHSPFSTSSPLFAFTQVYKKIFPFMFVFNQDFVILHPDFKSK
jgi:hypothetical protein